MSKHGKTFYSCIFFVFYFFKYNQWETKVIFFFFLLEKDFFIETKEQSDYHRGNYLFGVIISPIPSNSLEWKKQFENGLEWFKNSMKKMI